MDVTDPVCGKTIDLGAAESAEHHGWAYFFCSEACRAAFLAAPHRYAVSHDSDARESDPRGSGLTSSSHSHLRRRKK
ncbi:YHS domain-containing protein [Bauldia litoralis]|uniref:YHS domain-containing protein n=1 Tax=Bauldia litoralis TaxID=665467 RepID=UPI003D65D6A2